VVGADGAVGAWGSGDDGGGSAAGAGAGSGGGSLTACCTGAATASPADVVASTGSDSIGGAACAVAPNAPDMSTAAKAPTSASRHRACVRTVGASRREAGDVVVCLGPAAM
jgi:hypothetical protein